MVDIPVVSKLESGAWHAIARTLSVLLVLGIIGGAFWVGYEKGKTKGYSLASKDRATQSYEAQEQTIENVYNYEQGPAFSILTWGRLHLFSLDRKTAVPTATQKVINATEIK